MLQRSFLANNILKLFDILNLSAAHIKTVAQYTDNCIIDGFFMNELILIFMNRCIK